MLSGISHELTKEKFSKSKILNWSKMVSETWKYTFRIWKIRKKQNFQFLSFLGTIWYLWTAKMPKKAENAEISAKKWNSKVDFRPETDKLRPICGRKVRSEQNSSQNFFYRKRTKIDNFIPEKPTPPPKNRDFFLGGGGRTFICHLSQMVFKLQSIF